jgi:hypothetical protein
MYSLSTSKKMFATAAIIASASVTAVTIEREVAPVAVAYAASFAANTQPCPEHFHEIKIPSNGKFCQVFAAKLPASMIFFVPQPPVEIVEFYKQHSNTFSTTRQVKDRFLMQSSDKNTTLIISNDGQGTQVDILVKTESLL